MNCGKGCPKCKNVQAGDSSNSWPRKIQCCELLINVALAHTCQSGLTAAGYLNYIHLHLPLLWKHDMPWVLFKFSAGKSTAEVSVWKTDWSQKSPQVEQEAQPTGHHLDPHWTNWSLKFLQLWTLGTKGEKKNNVKHEFFIHYIWPVIKRVLQLYYYKQQTV